MKTPAPLPEGVVDVHGVAELLGSGLDDAYDWMNGNPGIVWRGRKRLMVDRENVLRWRSDPEFRRQAAADPRAKPQPQLAPRSLLKAG